MNKLKPDDKFTYCGREWTVLRVEEISYFANSPDPWGGHAVGYFSFAALETAGYLRSGR